MDVIWCRTVALPHFAIDIFLNTLTRLVLNCNAVTRNAPSAHFKFSSALASRR